METRYNEMGAAFRLRYNSEFIGGKSLARMSTLRNGDKAGQLRRLRYLRPRPLANYENKAR